MRMHVLAAIVLVTTSALTLAAACGEPLPSSDSRDGAVDVAAADRFEDDGADGDGGDLADADVDAGCTTVPCNVVEVATASPRTMAAGASTMVWVEGNTTFALDLPRAPLAVMSPENGGVASGFVTIGGSFVLMTNENGVRRCPTNAVCGVNPSTPMYGFANAGPVGIANNEMYVADRGGTRRLAVCGLTANCDTAPAVLAYLPAGAKRLVVTSSSVVVALDDLSIRAYLRNARLEAGAPAAQPLVTLGDPTGLAADGPDVYWTDGMGGTVGRCNADTCASTKATLVASGAYPRALAVSNAKLYWVETNGNSVHRCSLPACSDPTVIARVHRPTDLAVGVKLYVASESTGKIYVTAP